MFKNNTIHLHWEKSITSYNNSLNVFYKAKGNNMYTYKVMTFMKNTEIFISRIEQVILHVVP